MGYIYFPLTPALPLGERENRALALGHTRGGFCQASVGTIRGWRRLFPLPEGEGKGEGKRRFDSRGQADSLCSIKWGQGRGTGIQACQASALVDLLGASG